MKRLARTGPPRRAAVAAWLALAGAAAAAVAAQPESGPEGGARAAAVEPAPMDEKFGVLLRRSIFSRERVPAEDPRGADRGPGAETRPAPAVGPSPERNAVLAGVLLGDYEFLALVEDRTAYTTVALRVGDPVARGFVAEITLDSLTYEADGATRVIGIGQNMAGEVAAPAPVAAAPVAAAAPTTQGTAAATRPAGEAPAGTAPPGAPAGGPSNDVIERMRQRRLQEVGR